MVVAFGRHREEPDANDPRLRYGPVPQVSNVPGLPAGSTSYTNLPTGGRYEALDLVRAQQNSAVQAEMEREKLRKAIEDLSGSNQTYGPKQLTRQQFFSQIAGGPVDTEIAERAYQFASAMPELTPMQALKVAIQETRSDKPGRKSGQRGKFVNRAEIPADWAEKIAASGEVKPDLAAKNAIAAAEQGVTEDLNNVAALRKALDPEARAREVVAAAVGEQYRTTGRAENIDESAVLGRDRAIPGTGRRNPFNKEPIERSIDSAYRVPVLTALASQQRRHGPDRGFDWMVDEAGNPVMQPVAVKTGLKTSSGYDEKVFDPRQADVVMLDPTAQVEGYYRYTSPDEGDANERSGVGIGAPTPERQYYSREAADAQADRRYSSGSEITGFSPADDPATKKIQVPMTLGQVVEQIKLENRTPIKSYVVEDGPAGEHMVISSVGANGKLVYRNRINGQKLFPLANQNPRNVAIGVMDFRVGNPTEITNEGYRKLTSLIESLPGMRDAATGYGRRVLVNEPMMDTATNRAQNALLQQALSDEFIDVSDPSRKSIYSIVKALTAGKGVQPEGGRSPSAELLPRSSEEYQAVKPYLAASSLNPKVQQGRKEARKAPEGRPQLKSYEDFARAIGQEVGSERQELAMAEMARRIRARNADQVAVAEEASNLPPSMDAGVMQTEKTSQFNAPESPEVPNSSVDVAAAVGTPERETEGFLRKRMLPLRDLLRRR